MTQTIPTLEPDDDPAAAVDMAWERLDVYRAAVEYQKIAARVVSRRRVKATLRDQLDRASVSVVLNIAEGAGRQAPRDKAHLYTIARGSATECAAILDLLNARGLVLSEDHRSARRLLVRIVQMLTRLVARWTGAARLAG